MHKRREQPLLVPTSISRWNSPGTKLKSSKLFSKKMPEPRQSISAHIKSLPNLGQAWKSLNPAAKASLSAVCPVLWWCIRSAHERSPPNERTTRLMFWYSQGIALYGLRNMHLHLIRNIGVQRTFSRGFGQFSFLGSLAYTTSLWRTLDTWFGRTYFVFNLTCTLVYGYFLWLTAMYNRELPDPSAKRERGLIHWPTLVGFFWILSVTSIVFGSQMKTAIMKGDRYSFLSMVGFLMSSFGIVRAGFQTVSTSIPAITPFSAVSPLAVAYTLAALTHAPAFLTSPISRVYVMGYVMAIYCLVVIANFCLVAERAKEARKAVGRTTGGRTKSKM